MVQAHTHTHDVGLLSECCENLLLPLLNKEAAVAYGRTEYSNAGNLSRDREGKKVESGRCHVAAEGEKHQNFTSRPQPHGNTQINNRNGLV